MYRILSIMTRTRTHYLCLDMTMTKLLIKIPPSEFEMMLDEMRVPEFLSSQLIRLNFLICVYTDVE